MSRLLVIADGPAHLTGFPAWFADGGDFEIHGPIPSGRAAVTVAAAERPALALVDRDLPGVPDGEATARELRELGIPCLMFSARDARALPRANSPARNPSDTHPALLDVLQSVPCGIIAVDRGGAVRAVNAHAVSLFGFRAATVVGMPLSTALRAWRPGGDCPACHRAGGLDCGFRCITERAFAAGAGGSTETTFEALLAECDRKVRLWVHTILGRVNAEELCLLFVEDRTDAHALSQAFPEPVSFSGIVGRDVRMQELFETIRAAAGANVPVLLEGESGTGKELVANAIHKRGPRSERPFVAVNCGALPDTLLESELFGFVKGAFTGALRDRRGRFELADGGTLFLDEVAELSPIMQVKLLRVLQEGRFERLGSERTVAVDVRIVSATNKDLQRELAEGNFRRDLYYRLCVLPITIPPLRERAGDIPLLANHVLARIAGARGQERIDISPEALATLIAHDWPGNVRELENALQLAVVRSLGERVEPWHLPSSLTLTTGQKLLRPARSSRLTARAVEEALQATRGNRLQAARRLQVSRATLYRFLTDAAHSSPARVDRT